jgi:hypothetical protein
MISTCVVWNRIKAYVPGFLLVMLFWASPLLADPFLDVTFITSSNPCVIQCQDNFAFIGTTTTVMVPLLGTTVSPFYLGTFTYEPTQDPLTFVQTHAGNMGFCGVLCYNDETTNTASEIIVMVDGKPLLGGGLIGGNPELFIDCANLPCGGFLGGSMSAIGGWMTPNGGVLFLRSLLKLPFVQRADHFMTACLAWVFVVSAAAPPLYLAAEGLANCFTRSAPSVSGFGSG